MVLRVLRWLAVIFAIYIFTRAVLDGEWLVFSLTVAAIVLLLTVELIRKRRASDLR